MSGQVRVHDLSRGASLPIGQSSGITLAIGTAAILDIHNAREVVLTNATNTIKLIKSVMAVGEEVVFRATVAGTKIEQDAVAGTNIAVPGKTLTLAAGETATLKKTDSGALAFVIVGVRRNQEELEWLEVEGQSAKLEEAAGLGPKLQYAVKLGVAYLRGAVKVKAGEEIAINAEAFKLPAAARPANKQFISVATSEKPITFAVEAAGKVVPFSGAYKATITAAFGGLFYPLTG